MSEITVEIRAVKSNREREERPEKGGERRDERRKDERNKEDKRIVGWRGEER
jgi:hypothetical protein